MNGFFKNAKSRKTAKIHQPMTVHRARENEEENGFADGLEAV